MIIKLSIKTAFIIFFLLISEDGISQSLLFQENFESSTANWWNKVNGCSVIREIENSMLKVQGYNEVTFGESFWYDYRFFVHAKRIEGNFFFTMRYSSQGGYFLFINPMNINLNRLKREDGIDIENITLANKNIDIGLNTWHIYKIELIGNNIKVFIDNELMFNVIDEDPIFSGKVGINTSPNSVTYYDNILVETDRISPKQEFPWIGTSGPIGGMGYDVRIHPFNHDIMFATDIWSGVHKSYDGGKTWHARNKGIDLGVTPPKENKFGPSGNAIPVFCVTIDPTNPDNVWCGTRAYLGIYKSTDCGESWTKMCNGITIDENIITFRSFAVDPTNSDRVFAAGEIMTGRDEAIGFIFRTTDGGKNWVKVLDSQSLVRIILIDPRNPNILFASTGIFDCGSVKEEGIWKSTNGGDNWFHTNNGIDNQALTVEGLDFSIQNPDIMYASTGRCGGFNRGEHTSEGAIYRSDDAGNTWNTVLKRSPGLYFVPEYLAISQTNPDIVYVGLPDNWDHLGFSILRTMDGGKTWKYFDLWTEGVRGGNTISIAVHPHFSNILFLNFYGGGVIKSTDFGETWNIWSNGYTGAQIYDLTIDINNASLLYCTTREGPFKSTNGGRNWVGIGYSAAKNQAEWGAVQINPINSHTVIAGKIATNNLLKTTDGGYNWYQVLNPRPHYQSDATGASSISWSKSDTNVVFVSYNFNWGFITQPTDSTTVGVFKSDDAGETWHAVNNGFEETKKNVLTVEVHPKNSNIVFCSLSNEGIYRSMDGGSNWIKKNNGISIYKVRSFAFDPINTNTVYAGIENGGIFKSLDLGENWTQITWGMDQEASIRSIVINPQNHLDIFAYDWFSGIYRSIDAGQHWDIFNTGLSMRAGQSLAISNDGKLLYAGTEGGGVFRLTLAEFKTKVYEVAPDTNKTIRVKKGENIEFMIDAYDYNTDSLKYSWFLNNSVIKNQDSTYFIMKTDSMDVGKYFVFSKISDKDSTLTVKWKVEIYSCANNTIFENISICQGQNYNGWTTSGTYLRTLNSISGCDSIVSTNLTVFPSFKPNIIAHGDTLMSDKQYKTFQWYEEAGMIKDATQRNYIIKKGGKYYLVVKDNNGCINTSEVINAFHSGVKSDIYDAFRYSIFPNPGIDQFTFRINSNPKNEFYLKLINPLGQVIETRQVKSAGLNHEEQFNISSLSKGIYFLNISSVKFQICEKIIVQ